MRAKLTFLAVAIVLMAVGVATSEEKRSVLRYSSNNGSRSVVRPVTFNDESYPQEPPVHQPPQVSSYTPAAAPKVINLQQQQEPPQALPQPSQQFFNTQTARPVNHTEVVAADDVGGYDGHAAAAPRIGDVSTEYDVRSEVEALRTRLEQLEHGNAAEQGGACCPSACTCCCCVDPCCRSEGLYAGAEISFLEVFKSTGIGEHSADLNVFVPGLVGVSVPLFNSDLDTGFETTPRVWLGYQCADGVGIRAQYWEFDHQFTGGISFVGIPLPATTFQGFDLKTVDLELTDSTRLGCHWDMTGTYGVRYVEYEEVHGIGHSLLTLAGTKAFDGLGVTGSIELRRPLYSDLGFFSTFRVSTLYGDEDNNSALTIGPATIELAQHESNNVKYIFESHSGVELTTPMEGGGYYYARAGIETQFWGSFGMPTLFPIAEESVGFFGFMISAGIQR